MSHLGEFFMLMRLGRFAASHPWRFIAGWLLTVAVLVGAVLTIGPAFTDNITAPASESSEGLEILTANFPSAGGDDRLPGRAGSR